MRHNALTSIKERRKNMKLQDPTPPLSFEETKGLLNKIRNLPISKQIQVLLPLVAGLRPGEVANLKRTDINLEEGSVLVRSKTRDRAIPMPKFLVALLK